MFSTIRKAALRTTRRAATVMASVAAAAALLMGAPATAQDSAQFISQSVPTTMAAGRSYAVTVTMKNNGANTWTTAANYNLGSQNAQDNTRWGFGRVGLPGSTSVTTGNTATFSFNVTAPATAGTYNFQWRMVHDGVAWFGDYTTNVAIVVKQAQTITFPTISNKLTTDAPFAISATASSGLAVTVTSSTTGVCTVSGSTVTPVSVGTCTLVASQAGNATYAPEQTSQSFQVLNPQTITGFAPTTPIVYSSGASFTLSATGGASGNAVVFAATAGSAGICSLSGNVVSVLAAGTCTLTANQA
ncbi:MAG TPA: NBR1-Ig-like domain-containing protein, partial [Usitatibacteraceae bacterium]